MLLNDYGFFDMFNNDIYVDPKTFPQIFNCRVIDTYKQEWYSILERSSVLLYYKHFKTSLIYENYLDILPLKYRIYFCRLILSVQPLRIQTGMYASNNIPRE